MQLTMLHSKIHRARVTAAELHYNGSVGVDAALMKKAGMLPGQQVDVLSVDNGTRLTTYLIEEEAGSRQFNIYGPAARLIEKGHTIVIIAYARMTPEEARDYKPTTLVMNEKNVIEREI